MRTVRAFIAIPLPAHLAESIRTLQAELGNRIRNVRWVRPETAHLTLHFFAALEQEKLEKIRASMLSVERWQCPFDVSVRGLGVFPDFRRPRVLWLGLSPREQLAALHQTLTNRLRCCDVTIESRPYQPHLTIGRFRKQVPQLSELGTTMSSRDLGTFSVTQMVFYESRLSRHGAEHIPLFSVPLEAEG